MGRTYSPDPVRSRIKAVATEFGLGKLDSERKDLCIAGLELYVLKDEDLIYILRDAATISDARFRLKQRIREYKGLS